MAPHNLQINYAVLRGNDQFMPAYSTMRGEKYDNFGPIFDMPWVDKEPKENPGNFRLHENAPGAIAR